MTAFKRCFHLQPAALRPGQEHFYGSPSVVGALDGRLHVLYTYRGAAIKHVIVDEAWVMAGRCSLTPG